MMPYKDDYETIQGLWMLGVSPIIEQTIPTKITASPVQGKPNLAVGSPDGAAIR